MSRRIKFVGLVFVICITIISTTLLIVQSPDDEHWGKSMDIMFWFVITIPLVITELEVFFLIQRIKTFNQAKMQSVLQILSCLFSVISLLFSIRLLFFSNGYSLKEEEFFLLIALFIYIVLKIFSFFKR